MLSAAVKSRLIEMIVLSAVFGAVFLFLNYLHFRILPVRVILYACIWDILLTTMIVGAGWWLVWRRRSGLLLTEAALVAIASDLLLLVYAIMGPTVIDRSLSLYIVQKLDQRGGEISQATLNDVFVREFIPEFRIMDVRTTEQLNSGTAELVDGCLKLTGKGKQLSSFVGFYRKNFLPRRRVLLGEVTDQLTRPFDYSRHVVDTTCEPDASGG